MSSVSAVPCDVDRGAAEEVLVEAPVLGDRAQELERGGHDLGADPVAGQGDDGGHWSQGRSVADGGSGSPALSFRACGSRTRLAMISSDGLRSRRSRRSLGGEDRAHRRRRGSRSSACRTRHVVASAVDRRVRRGGSTTNDRRVADESKRPSHAGSDRAARRPREHHRSRHGQTARGNDDPETALHTRMRALKAAHVPAPAQTGAGARVGERTLAEVVTGTGLPPAGLIQLAGRNMARRLWLRTQKSPARGDQPAQPRSGNANLLAEVR